MPDPSARATRPSFILGARGAAALTILVAAGVSQAQPYRYVAADGRVTYSDIPPAGAGVAPRAAPSRNVAATSATPLDRADASIEAATGVDRSLAALPYAVRTAAERHPIVLYTSADCSPCADARSFLARRGAPFTEQQVASGADLAALRQRGFAGDGFPAVSVGAQRLTGFDAGTWGSLLDAAGYPKTSALPPGWRAPTARPLADGSAKVAAAAASTTGAGAPGAAQRASPFAAAPGSATSDPRTAQAAPVAGGSPGFRF